MHQEIFIGIQCFDRSGEDSPRNLYDGCNSGGGKGSHQGKGPVKKMKEKYKYIFFEKVEVKRIRTGIWTCYNNNQKVSAIGIVRWYYPWHQYCFFPSNNTVFSDGCLADIRDFLTNVKNWRNIANDSKTRNGTVN
jgi:hypothetical protein